MGNVVPEKYREVLEAIDNEVVSVHLAWKYYLQLYGKDNSTVAFLNRVAPGFFHVVQSALLDHVLLSILRLLDPQNSGKGRDNLVIERLRPIAQGHPKAEAELDAAITRLQTACPAMRKHRDKRVAHSDLVVALGRNQLPGFSRKAIEDALEALRDAMNAIHVHFRKTTSMYKDPIVRGGGDTLLYCLRDGVSLERIRRQLHRTADGKLRQMINESDSLAIGAEVDDEAAG